MRMNALLQKAVISKVGSRKMVTLPVSTWKKIKEKIEDLEEDYLMATSENYKKSIAKARKTWDHIPSEEVYRLLGLAK